MTRCAAADGGEKGSEDEGQAGAELCGAEGTATLLMVRGMRKQDFLGKLDGRIPTEMSRFTEAQVVAALRRAEAGSAVPGLCREHGIGSAAFHEWRAGHGGMDASMLSRSAR